MAPIGKPPGKASDLRKQAEVLARGKAAASATALLLEPEATQALHELQVHRIELELRNEELRRAQLELDTLRARYYDLYDQATVGHCTLNEHGLILETNQTATTLLGVPRGAMIKQLFSCFIHPGDKDLFYINRRLLLDTEDPQAWEMRMLKGDGTVFWGHLQATAEQDTDGADMIRIMLSDVTERKMSEETLHKISIAVEQSPVSIVITDIEGAIQYVNPKFTQ
jgi:PAS domain S-box-containing protein